MGYVFDFSDAKAYEQRLKQPHHQRIAELENQLLLDMLNPMPGKTVLDIGCGTGASLIPLIEAGLRVTGLDPSTYMLDIARHNIGNRVILQQGFAEDLPFDDNSFNYACLNTTLEFTEDPQKAMEEAFRVAKNRIFIGVLNRYAIGNIHLRIKGMFNKTIFNRARFFSVWELKLMIRALLGDVPLSWRTVCHLPLGSGKLAHTFERLWLIQRCPFGLFAGMVVTPVPRFTTTPLSLRYGAKQRTGELTTST